MSADDDISTHFEANSVANGSFFQFDLGAARLVKTIYVQQPRNSDGAEFRLYLSNDDLNSVSGSQYSIIYQEGIFTLPQIN